MSFFFSKERKKKHLQSINEAGPVLRAQSYTSTDTKTHEDIDQFFFKKKKEISEGSSGGEKKPGVVVGRAEPRSERLRLSCCLSLLIATSTEM